MLQLQNVPVDLRAHSWKYGKQSLARLSRRSINACLSNIAEGGI